MPLHVESDSCDHSGVGTLGAKKCLEKLCIFVFCHEGKIFIDTFW